jgi:hypothetical protein
MRKAPILVTIGLCFVLGGCTTSAPDDRNGGPERPATTAEAAEVDWENYSPSVQTRIDELGANKDCAGLQGEFDTAEANNANQREGVGDGNTDLMSYIDDKLKEAGCS